MQKFLGGDEGQENLINRDVKMALHVADLQLMGLTSFVPALAMLWDGKISGLNCFRAPTPAKINATPQYFSIV